MSNYCMLVLDVQYFVQIKGHSEAQVGGEKNQQKQTAAEKCLDKSLQKILESEQNL